MVKLRFSGVTAALSISGSASHDPAPKYQLTGAERWFVVHTLPQRDCSAERQLANQGFRTFLPKIIKTVRHARTLRTVRAPVFPSYIFVALDLGRDRWRCINGTLGVAGLIMANQRPQPIPSGVIEALYDLQDESGMLRFDRSLTAGQRIRVRAGPFAQAVGTLERLDDKGRVRVLLEIMGGHVTAQLDRSILEPVL